jgi:hypothetical protein
MAALATLLLSLPLAADAADEGRKIILWMLAVGLLFVGVIALGETSRWLRHRGRRY